MKRIFQAALFIVHSILLSSCHTVPESLHPSYQNSQLTSLTSPKGQGMSLADGLMIKAANNLQQKHFTAALALLQQAQRDEGQLDSTARLTLHQLFASAFFGSQRVLAAIDSSTVAENLLSTPKDKEKYLATIWENLQTFSKDELTQSRQAADNATQRGWLDLVLNTADATIPSALLQNIAAWRTSYSDHPAQLFFSHIEKHVFPLTTLPQQIALLLPLTGPFAKQGRAIRNGFFAAYYQNTVIHYTPEIQLFDTNQETADVLYQKAINAGAKLVIGPLVKTNLEQLISKEHLTVPVIALNHLSTKQPIENLYQFALSPENETLQVAEKMTAEHHQRILVIVPDNAFGSRIQSVFENTWLNLGGQITNKLIYQSRQQLPSQLQTLLNLDQSKQRFKQLQRALDEKLRFIPRRRQDFDAIFLIAYPAMAKQIVPLLRFYYANTIPIYSISDIYSENTLLGRDLDGVLFNDIPWVLTDITPLNPSLSSIRKNVQTAWPISSKKYSHFFALGADAFSLITTLNKLSLLPLIGMNGATGRLYLEPNGQVYRTLSFAKIKNGRPHHEG